MREIVILSSINWEYYWQRPQQLAVEFAALGCKVLYVQGDWSNVNLSRRPSESEWAPLMNQAIRSTLKEERGVQICTPIVRATIGNVEPVEITEAWLTGVCEALALQNPIFWVVGWQWGQHVDLLRARGQVIYDCVDDLSGFDWATPAILAAEERLVQNASLAVGVSRKLVERLRSRGCPAELLPNGVEPERFTPALESPRARRWSAPVLGFVGALAEWVDTELLARIAQSFPQATLLLVGGNDGADFAPLRGLKNLVMVGRVPYEELPAYMAEMDVALVPFKRGRELLDCADAIKVYEYLAAGRPVVTTPYGDVDRLGDLVYLAADEGRFLEAIAQALGDGQNQQARERRLAFARANTWRDRAERALDLIEQASASPTRSLAASTMVEQDEQSGPNPLAPEAHIPGRSFYGIYVGHDRMLITPVWGGRLLVPASDLSLMPDLVTTGLIEPPLTQYLLKRLKPGMKVLDVGTKIGYFTVLAAQLVGEGGRVIGYEADPVAVRYLMENLALNGLQERCTLQAEPWDRGLAEIERIDLLKIDLEGSEFHAFQGVRRLLREGRIGTIAFKINALVGTEEHSAIATLLRAVQAESGTRLYGLRPDGELQPITLEQLFAQTRHPFAILQ